MKLLVIGSGGREHAISYHLLQSPKVESVYCAPGNPGMALDGITCVPIKEMDFASLADFAKKEKIDWTFIGPEAPLFEGIVDYFEEQGLKAFGPSKAASQIEGSKRFAKELMAKHKIPTAKFAAFKKREEALAYLEKHVAPIVVKINGPAAGKGVTVAATMEEAREAVNFAFDLTEDNEILIEECMEGPEFSIFSLVQGGLVCHFLPARDHKRVFDGDKGPNTGGMGAFAPVPDITEDIYQTSLREIVEPTLVAMEKEGHPFEGVLYTGLMLTADGPKVIEFNARFGDPETQVVLPLLKTDFASLVDDLIHGYETAVEWHKDKTCLGVILAAPGYPGSYEKGIQFDLIAGREQGIKTYFAGVSGVAPFVSSGGRIAMVTSAGRDLAQARGNVYDYLQRHELAPIFYRKDIGKEK